MAIAAIILSIAALLVSLASLVRAGIETRGDHRTPPAP